MQKLTEQGKAAINDLAYRYGLSNETVMTMLYAVMNGGGTMAQFNCPELGGSGQWMQGGMTMVGDMFNYNLKATVDNLCYEISGLLSNQQSLFAPAPKPQQQNNSFQGGQQQSQGGGQQQSSQQNGFGQTSLFISGNSGNWWPDELGMASSTGSQNNIRYAVFPQTGRLAVEINGHVTVYDTLDHQIGGVSQQQGYGSSFTFTSQYGLVQVDQLPVVSVDGVSQSKPVESAPSTMQSFEQSNQSQSNQNQSNQNNVQQPAQFESSNAQSSPSAPLQQMAESDIFATIEKLAGLKDKGILSDEEFSRKKAELLERL